MIRFFLLAIAIAGASAISQARAQTTPPPPPSLSCADFQKNADGSWSPVHPVTVGAATISPGVTFREGVSIGGLDLAATLNKQCVRH